MQGYFRSTDNSTQKNSADQFATSFHGYSIEIQVWTHHSQQNKIFLLLNGLARSCVARRKPHVPAAQRQDTPCFAPLAAVRAQRYCGPSGGPITLRQACGLHFHSYKGEQPGPRHAAGLHPAFPRMLSFAVIHVQTYQHYFYNMTSLQVRPLAPLSRVNIYQGSAMYPPLCGGGAALPHMLARKG